jgi:hypothetical protein
MRGSADSALRAGFGRDANRFFIAAAGRKKKNRSVETERFLRHEG